MSVETTGDPSVIEADDEADAPAKDRRVPDAEEERRLSPLTIFAPSFGVLSRPELLRRRRLVASVSRLSAAST